MHSKGVTRNGKGFTDWRILCDYFTMSKWKLNIELLKENDCVGINLLKYPKLHFSGNFWWSKSEYLNKLEEPINNKRLSPEMYICDHPEVKAICHYNKYSYNVPHDKSLYDKLSDEELITTNIPRENPHVKYLMKEC